MFKAPRTYKPCSVVVANEVRKPNIQIRSFPWGGRKRGYANYEKSAEEAIRNTVYTPVLGALVSPLGTR